VQILNESTMAKPVNWILIAHNPGSGMTTSDYATGCGERRGPLFVQLNRWLPNHAEKTKTSHALQLIK